jgi:trehalose synthase-fused probable maltokinase
MQILPLNVEPGDDEAALEGRGVRNRFAILETGSGGRGLLYSGLHDGAMSNTLLELITSNQSHSTAAGATLSGFQAGPFAVDAGESAPLCLVPDTHRQQQRNESVVLSDLFVLKMFRRLEPGPNPDVETVRFLFEKAGFAHLPPVVGVVEYTPPEGAPMTAGVLHGYVEHRNDFWTLTTEALSLFLERAAAEPGSVDRFVTSYVKHALLIGRRTAELHLALSSDPADPAFAPEEFNSFYLRGAAHRLTSTASWALHLLALRRDQLPRELQSEASRVLKQESRILELLRGFQDFPRPGMRIRIHGDLHLGQILYTGDDDAVFIDFEGDNSRSLIERRIKRSALLDVAGLIHSLRYAAASAGASKLAGTHPWRSKPAQLRDLLAVWVGAVSTPLIAEYRHTVRGHNLVPESDSDFEQMLQVLLTGKAVYQLLYELENRPGWTGVALRTLLEIVA